MIKARNFILFYFFLLFLYTFFTQFSSIYKEVIDWDESTFIILSQSVKNGFLPYEKLWDLKGPVHYLLLGGSFKIFGDTFLVARLTGDMIIFLSSIVLFKFCRNKFNTSQSLSISTIFLALNTLNFSQPFMTEHTATFFLLLSLNNYIKRQNKFYFFSGIFLSLSILTRTNLIILIAVAAIYFLKMNKYKSLLYFMNGLLLPMICFSLIYFLRGTFEYFYYTLILLPLANILIRENFLEFLFNNFNNIFLDNIFSIQTIVFILFICSVLFFTFEIKGRNSAFVEIDNFTSLNIFVLFTILISILLTGRFFYHYFILTFPFLSILIIYFITHMFKRKTIAILIVTFFILLSTINTFIKGVKNFETYELIYSSYPVKQISKLVDKNSTILALENHLIYFYLNIDPITPIIHPNVIFKTNEYVEMLNLLTDLGYIKQNQSQIILDSHPRYIVCENFCFEFIDDTYFDNYELIVDFEGVKLFEYKLN